LIPLQATLRLNYYLNKDTRAKTETWIKASGEKAIFENYSSVLSERAAKKSKLASSSFYQYAGCLAELDLATIKNQKVRYLASSSFMYDRYFLGNKLKNQHKRIYKYYREYQSLFSYPFIEVKPAYKSFAFSNPTIRIIDINPETVKD
jgi:guanyl-specific ribonuclease Sa